jgi:hypothetical protein
MPPVEEEVSDGYSLARRHLDAIDQAESVINALDWRRPFATAGHTFGMPDGPAIELVRKAYANMATSPEPDYGKFLSTSPATQSTDPKG